MGGFGHPCRDAGGRRGLSPMEVSGAGPAAAILSRGKYRHCHSQPEGGCGAAIPHN